jgi:melanoma-associated antigen
MIIIILVLIPAAALQTGSQAKATSGAYILCSTLRGKYRAANIMAPNKAPSAAIEAGYTGFYTLVVSLIWLNGGELSDQKLQRHLTRLNANENTSVDKTANVLAKMQRQGYILKKVEKPLGGQVEEETITWLVGPRGREEIGVHGVAGMVREVWGNSDPELEKKLRTSLGLKEPEPAPEPAPETNSGRGDNQTGAEVGRRRSRRVVTRNDDDDD